MSYAAPLVKDSELIKLLRDKTKVPKKDYVVIDGGNIPGAVNVPSRVFVDNVHKLIEDYKDVPQVFFHCALSQSRGPKAARIYNESKNLHGIKSDQKVAVLQGGFEQWYINHRKDTSLIENHDPEAMKGLLFEYGLEDE
ncbi:Cdc25 phosphatase Ibp1 [Umbelopsis sp. WA50703]